MLIASSEKARDCVAFAESARGRRDENHAAFRDELRLRGGAEFAAIDNLTGYNCGYWGAAEGAAVEGCVAGFAGRFGCVIHPREVGRKNCDIGGATHRDFSFDAQDA